MTKIIPYFGAVITLVYGTTSLVYAANEPIPLSDALQVAQERQEDKDSLLFSPHPWLGQNNLTSDKPTPKLDDTRFWVHTIQWKEMPSEFSFLEKETKHWKPQAMRFSDIQHYVDTLNQKLVEKGYATTRVQIPNQNIADGVLELALWSGRVGKIEIDHSHIHQESIFPDLSGKHLNLRPIEQGVDVLRSSGRQVQIELVPTTDPHVHDIVVHTRTDKPIHLQLGIDNDGSSSTRNWRYTGYIQWDRPFLRNDTLGMSYAHHIPKRTPNESVMYGVNYRYPYRDWEFSYRYSHHKSSQILPLPIPDVTYTQRNRQDRASLQVKKLLSRTAKSKEYIRLSLDKRESRYDINGVELKIRRQKITTLTLGYAYLHYLQRGAISSMIGVQRGISLWGAMDRISKESPNPRYTKWIGDMDYYRLLTPNLQYRLSFHGEYSNDWIYDDDRLSIGNRYTVRGVSERDSFHTAKGMYLQQTWTRQNVISGMNVYGGIDIGIGVQNSKGVRSLVSASIGIQGGKAIRYDVLYGLPLNHRKQLYDPHGVLSVQLSYQW